MFWMGNCEWDIRRSGVKIKQGDTERDRVEHKLFSIMERIKADELQRKVNEYSI